VARKYSSHQKAGTTLALVILSEDAANNQRPLLARVAASESKDLHFPALPHHCANLQTRIFNPQLL